MMFSGVPATQLLGWINELRIWAGGLAAVAAVVTGIATYAQLRLQTIVSVEKDAALEAQRRASDERISTNERETAVANAAAATATATAATANERAAELEKEATEAKLALAKLQDRLAPRRLTAEQASILGNELRGPPMVIAISVLAGDPEAQAYTDQLVTAMNQSGSVQGDVISTIFSGAVVGLRMSRTTTPEAKRLENALRKAGIPFTFSGATPELRMSIGTKPD